MKKGALDKVYSAKRYRYQSFIHRLRTLKKRVHIEALSFR